MSHITYNMYLAYVFNKILFFVQFIYIRIIDMSLCCVCCFLMYDPAHESDLFCFIHVQL